ncbi:MAG: sigma-70 family RNA polymerase sigma factor [Alphaproteobacteria bacterium]|nr:sigma-70 family RNA polymerase sigma factor [Alphaproteobacteria bacterium]
MSAEYCSPDEIAALVRARDLKALDRITRCYGEHLLAAGRRHCATEADAQDAVQDALVTAGLHLGDWRGEGPVEGWVVRMVARACGRMRRGRKNDPALHVTEAPLPGEADPEDDAAVAELRDALNASLLLLSETDRAILVMAEVEGWKGPEIAEAFGMTPAAVRKRLSRARRVMRVQLAARGVM